MKIVIIDSDYGTRWILRRILKDHEIIEATSFEEALLILGNERINIALVTRELPDGNGYELIEKFKEVKFIILISNPAIENVKEGLKKGAVGYIKKPLHPEKLREILEKALSETRVREDEIIIHSPKVINAFKQIKRFVEEELPFVVVGKEHTGRKTLIRTVLKQTEKQADVTELEALSLQDQKKIAENIKTKDWYCIFISQEDPYILEAEKKLHPELLSLLEHRIIEIPPLKERKEEIPHFIELFRKIWARNTGKVPPAFSQNAIENLKKYSWPGNLKQLQSVVFKLLETTQNVIHPSDLPVELTYPLLTFIETLRKDVKRLLGIEKNIYDTIINAVEKVIIEEAMKEAKGNKIKASQLIGIHRNTLRMKLKKIQGAADERDH